MAIYFDINQQSNFIIIYYYISFLQFVIIQLMASRYIQKYPIPQEFPLVLKNFTRQILRDQPQNVIEYAANYFQALDAGKPFTYKSIYNVSKDQKKYELTFAPTKAQEMIKKDIRINNISGALDKKQLQRVSKIVDLIFQQYDKNRSGRLEGRQMKEIVRDLYKEGHIDILPTDAEIGQFVLSIDLNTNGCVERNQMTGFIRKLIG